MLYEKHMATEVATDALMKSGKVMWSESVVGMTNKVFPWSKVLWSMAEYTCCWVRGIFVIDQGELEKGSASLFMDANLSVLNFVIENTEEDVVCQ